MIEVLGYLCLASAALLAALNVAQRAHPIQTERPCIYCGRMLRAPIFACEHYLGDGREGV